MDMTDTERITAIAQAAARAAPPGWQRIHLSARAWVDLAETAFEFEDEAGRRCAYAPDVHVQHEVDAAFHDWSRAMAGEGRRWTVARLQLEPTGQYQVAFEDEDTGLGLNFVR
jgi:hypothetical protein